MSRWRIRRGLFPNLIPIILLLALSLSFYADYTPDSTFITLRYAENFTNGRGLTFNPGEGAMASLPVESYDSLLWVLLSSPAYLVGTEPLVWIKFLGFILSALTLLFLSRVISIIFPNIPTHLTILPSIMLAIHPGFLLHALSGSSIPLFWFIFTLILYFIVRAENDKYGIILGLLAGLITFARVEGVIITLAILIYYLLAHKPKTALNLFTFYLLFFLPLITFRAMYYHELVPNTYYVKATLPLLQRIKLMGLPHIVDFISQYHNIFLLLFTIVAGYFIFTKRKKLIILLVLSLTLIVVVLCISSLFEELLVLGYPLFLLLSACGLIYLPNSLAKYNLRGHFTVYPLLLVYLALTTTFIVNNREVLREYLSKREEQREIALWLRTYLGDGEMILTDNTGLIPFYSGLRTIDLRGYFDPAIARYYYRHNYSTSYTDLLPPEKLAKINTVTKSYILNRLNCKYILLNKSSDALNMFMDDKAFQNSCESIMEWDSYLLLKRAVAERSPRKPYRRQPPRSKSYILY